MSIIPDNISMYRMRPVYDPVDSITLPDCMYRSPVYHSPTSRIEQASAVNGKANAMVSGNMQTGDDIAIMQSIGDRQERLRTRLRALEASLTELSAQYPTVSAADSASQASARPGQKATNSFAEKALPVLLADPVPLDIAVAADPDAPPYGLMLMLAPLASHVRLLSSVHVHSTAAGLVPAPLVHWPLASSVASRHQAQIVLTLIWRKGLAKPTLCVKAGTSHLEGEGQILRLLSRLLPAEHSLNFEGAGAAGGTAATDRRDIDWWLDAIARCHDNGGSAADADWLLGDADGQLASGQWLGGGTAPAGVSIADFALWSLIRRRGLHARAAAKLSLADWLKRCSQSQAFECVQRL